jgi:hypothetical protein
MPLKHPKCPSLHHSCLYTIKMKRQLHYIILKGPREEEPGRRGGGLQGSWH